VIRATFIILITICLPAFISSAYAEKVLTCSEEIATGFESNGGIWETSDYEKSRYTIEANDDFTRLVKGISIFECRPAFAADYEPNLVTCFMTAEYTSANDKTVVEFGGPPEFFFFNRDTLRYVFANVSTGGFADNGDDSDNLSAGKCETS